MKVVLTILGIMLVIISVTMAVYFNQNAAIATRNLDQERYKRMVAEENSLNTQNKIEVMELELKRSNDKLSKAGQILEQTNASNASLKTQLNDADKTAKELEGRLKNIEESSTQSEPQPASPG